MCAICGQAFATKQRITGHLLTHSGEKHFNCAECDKRFATEQRLKCHQRTHVSVLIAILRSLTDQIIK